MKIFHETWQKPIFQNVAISKYVPPLLDKYLPWPGLEYRSLTICRPQGQSRMCGRGLKGQECKKSDIVVNAHYVRVGHKQSLIN